MDLRYSEVIYEVMEAILKEKRTDVYLVSEMLERISLLPVHQRSMDTVLRMLSDRMTCSFYLTDSDLVNMNYASWPVITNVALTEIGNYYGNDVTKIPKEPKTVMINRSVCICAQQIRNENALPMQLIIAKENGGLSFEICRQAAEVVQLFVNIWSQSHGNIGTAELVKAILNDEPMKMRRLAEILHIDVKSIHHLLLVQPEKNSYDSAWLEKFNQRVIKKSKATVQKFFQVSLYGIYNDCFVIFMGKESLKDSCELIVEALLHDLNEQGEQVILVSNFGLKNTTEVRNAYVTGAGYLRMSHMLYPDKHAITYQELQFTKRCHEIIMAGENAIKMAQMVLSPIESIEAEQKNEFLMTLETYLLDSDLNVTITAEKMFLHKNTIKYRISRLNEKFNFKINKMPEAYELYKAVAIQRLLKTIQK